jgi:hypothetical protein
LGTGIRNAKIFFACVYKRVVRSDRNIEIAANTGGKIGPAEWDSEDALKLITAATADS